MHAASPSSRMNVTFAEFRVRLIGVTKTTVLFNSCKPAQYQCIYNDTQLFWVGLLDLYNVAYSSCTFCYVLQQFCSNMSRLAVQHVQLLVTIIITLRSFHKARIVPLDSNSSLSITERVQG